MFKNTIFRRMTALVLTLALAAAAALPGLAVYPMPIQTAKETEAVYLFNADTGKTILNPVSYTHLTLPTKLEV